jgi:hypothetical protein
MVLPQEMALSLVHLVYMARGVPARNLYMRLKITNPTTWDTTPAAIVRPWTMKYEM